MGPGALLITSSLSSRERLHVGSRYMYVLVRKLVL